MTANAWHPNQVPCTSAVTCILADIKTGKPLEIYDCFRELPADAPAWVEALEASP